MIPSDFDLQPRLGSPALSLAPLVEADRVVLAAAASDPEIWAGHPAKDRWRPDVFGPYFDNLLASGALTVRDGQGRVIGCTRFYPSPVEGEGLAVGYTFLVRDHWGGGTNFELKRLMLAHAFGPASEPPVESVWFHIDPGNLRSQIAISRLGGVHVATVPVNLTGREAIRMSLRLTSVAWERTLAVRRAPA